MWLSMQGFRRTLARSSCVSLIAGIFVTIAPVAIGESQVAHAAATSCVSAPQTGRVTGMITNKSSGSEVAYTSGARVRLIDLDEEAVVSCVIADSTGRYAINTTLTGNGYLISVDPAPGAPSILGSSGGAIRLTSASIVRNYSLSNAAYQGVATFNNAFPTDTYVCLEGQLNRRCGFVVSRSDSQSPRFALSDSDLVGDVYSLVARKNSDGINVNGYVEISTLVDASNINIKMETVLGDVSKTNGCMGGKTPNVIGRVTMGGSAYSTTVRLGLSWADYSPTTAPAEFWTSFTTTSALDGSYKFCVDTSVHGVPKVLRTVATVANLGTNPGLGDTYSTWINSNCLLGSIGCEIPSFEMKSRFLWGTIVFDSDGNANTPAVPLSNANLNIYKQTDNELAGWNAYFQTDTLGRFSVSGIPQTGEFYVYVSPSPSCASSSSTCNAATDLNGSALSKGVQFALAGSPKEMNVQLDRGNIRLSAVDPDGYDLSSMYAWSNLRIVPATDACRVELRVDYSSECNVETFPTYYEKAPTTHVANLAPGTYNILMSANSYSTSISTMSVSQAGVVSVLSGPVVASGGNRFVQKVSDGNVKFRINWGPDSKQIAPGSFRVDRFYTSDPEFEDGFNGSQFDGFIDESGFVKWNAYLSGIYRFTFEASPTNLEIAGYVSTERIYEIQVVDGVASILHTCVDPVGSATPVCVLDPPTISSGSVQVSLKKANFQGELCSALPIDSCVAPIDVGREIRLTQTYPNTGKDWSQYQSRTSKFYFDIPYVTATGNFNIYTLSVRVWSDGLYANQIRILKISSSGIISYCGSSLVKLEQSKCVSSTALEIDSSTDRTILPTIRLRTGNVNGIVLEPGISTKVVSDSRICFLEVTSSDTFCWGNTQNSFLLDPFRTQSNEVGEFTVDLDPGTYKVQASPGYSQADGSEFSEGTSTFTVDSDGVLTEPLIIRLAQPNVVGQILAGDSPVSYSSIQVFKPSVMSSSGWEAAGFGASSKSSGRFYLDLSPGTWKLVATPSGANAEAFTAGSVKVVVDANGDVESVDDVAYIGGAIDLRFNTPTLKLSLGNTGVSGLSVNFMKRNASSGYYEYMNENGYYWMSSTRGAAILLTEGRYQFNLYPYNTPGFVTTTYFLKVDGNGVVCTVANGNSTTCLQSLATGEILTVSLNGPNIKGVVRNGSGGVGATSYLQVERFNTNSQNFEWSPDVQGSSSNASGAYAMRLPVGFYRITANPYSLTSGFTKGIEYVVVYEENNRGATWCKPGGTNPAPCNGPLKGPSDTFDINLRAANVKGLVKFGSDLVTNSYINVEKFVEQGFQWVNEYSQVQQGAFVIKLDGGTAPVKYRLTINQPNPNPNKLGKKKITLWVGDFVAGGPDDDVCIQDTLSVGGTIPQTCSEPIASGSQFEIQMSQGNVSGIVSDPTGAPVASSFIEVRVWNNAFSYWNWTDNYSYTPTNGSYALQLEAGTYQVTARTPYGSSAFTDSAAQLILVNANGSWCRISSKEDTECVENAVSLNISLRNPNLSGVLTDGTSPVVGVWMSVQKQQTSGDYSWWNWINMTATTSNIGKFALNISDDGDYRLEISAPYGNSKLPRFYKYYTVNSGNICEGQGCIPSSSSLTLQELSYPAPNFIGTVYSPTNQRVSNVGVDVEVWDVNGYWRWANLYANVGPNGSFAMVLPSDARYRLRVNPPWNGVGYPRFTQIVEVNSDGEACAEQDCTVHEASLELDLKFPTANVLGKVVLKADGEVTSISRWSWMYAYNGSSNEWANTSAAGEYSMYLADGEWTMWFYPDYSRSSAQPIQVFAKVENGELISWRYAVDVADSNQCVGSTPCKVDVSFDYIPPNVRVKVTENETALAGAFVQLENVETTEVFDFTTDANGLIEGFVPIGSYKVTALKVVGSTVTSVEATIEVTSSIATGANSIVLSLPILE